MTKQLIIVLSLLFVACNNSEERPSDSIKNSNHILKLSNDSKDELSVIYTNYDEAYSVAKRENKAVFILFYTDYCRWCRKLKETTLKDKKLKSYLEKEFVVLFLNKHKDQYPKKYKIKGVPTVYMTDKNEEIFTSMVGYYKDPKDYIKWFDYIKTELKN